MPVSLGLFRREQEKKRVHLQASLELKPKAVRLLLKGFRIPSCFGIKALCGGFLQAAMDPAAMDPARLRGKFENPSLIELAFRRHFLVLVFVVYVTRPVVVTAAVYDEQSIYYFMSPCKGVLTRELLCVSHVCCLARQCNAR
jgi:hypothetical protein